jgi:hypothetical protein
MNLNSVTIKYSYVTFGLSSKNKELVSAINSNRDVIYISIIRQNVFLMLIKYLNKIYKLLNKFHISYHIYHSVACCIL